MRNIDEFSIYENQSILEALKKIDLNRSGFIIVLTTDDLVVGTLTDGDIRKYLINGGTLDGLCLDACNQNCETITEYDSIIRVIDLFKLTKLSFLPILDKKGRLINVITKKDMHFMLIHDMKMNLQHDFINFNNCIIDNEIYGRPWGIYHTTFYSEFVQAKVIRVEPGAQLSLQKHYKREEHWIIIKGSGILTLDSSQRKIYTGDYVFLPKGCLHRIKNLSSNEYLYISEIQLGDYFGEDDIKRFDDDYGRV